MFIQQYATLQLFLVLIPMLENILSKNSIFTFKKILKHFPFVFNFCVVGGEGDGERVYLFLPRDYDFKFQLKWNEQHDYRYRAGCG